MIGDDACKVHSTVPGINTVFSSADDDISVLWLSRMSGTWQAQINWQLELCFFPLIITTINDIVPNDHQRISHQQKILEKIKCCFPCPSQGPSSSSSSSKVKINCFPPLAVQWKPSQFEVHSLLYDVLLVVTIITVLSLSWEHSV